MNKIYDICEVKKWLLLYNETLNIETIVNKFGVAKSTVYNLFRYYRTQKVINFEFSFEIQERLFKDNKRLCLPISGCGKIKTLNNFYFRKDSGKYKEQCKDCRAKYQKEWHLKNPEYSKIHNVEYGKMNRKIISDNEKIRKNTDIEFKITKNLRGRLKNVLKFNLKSGSAVKDLGCSAEELKKHLEKQFYNNPETKEQMTWENYGLYGWHIDHIKPLSSFNLTNREELLKACHYTNLQPLWATENLSKGSKILIGNQNGYKTNTIAR